MVQFLEECKRDGLVPTLHEFIYVNREAIILERDLPSFTPKIKKNKPPEDVEFVEISDNNFEHINPVYPLKFRYLKALKNLDKGYRAFAVLKDREVVGDLWYATPQNSKKSVIHPDLEWLDIELGKDNVYATDTYVTHEERGNYIAHILWNYALGRFREKGFNKVYGYVWADNIPALWLYRVLKFRDVKRIKMNRFIYFQLKSHITHRG